MPKPKFAEGNTVGKDNHRKKRIRKSKLRKTLDKLYELEPKAMENIKAAVEGHEVDKTTVDVSKWVVQQLQSVTKSATMEEAEMNGLRLKMDEYEKEDEDDKQDRVETPTAAAVFSLVVPKREQDKSTTSC